MERQPRTVEACGVDGPPYGWRVWVPHTRVGQTVTAIDTAAVCSDR